MKGRENKETLRGGGDLETKSQKRVLKKIHTPNGEHVGGIKRESVTERQPITPEERASPWRFGEVKQTREFLWNTGGSRQNSKRYLQP